jgi:D-inositol-3-phosphate glycosyltransferase
VRIAMVSEHASPLATLGGADAGGQNVHVAALATTLGRRGHDVTVFTRRDDPGLPSQVKLGPGAVVEHVDAGPPALVSKDELLPWMDAFGQHLRRAFLRRPPDLVHAHFWMSGLATLAAVRGLGIPVVQTFHALGVVKRRHQGSKDPSPAARLGIEETLAREVDLIVATCSDEVFELARLGADLKRIRVVPCGVDVELFRPDGPVEQRRSNLARVAVVTRLVERKGVGNVITALRDVPAAELVVAGGPPADELDRDPEASRLLALAEKAGVSDRIELRGRMERLDLPALLRSADVAVCVPWYEPFGIVPLEAMACGVPVLATAVGGLVDTVVHRRTGLHVPPREPRSIAAALRELLGDRKLRRTLGAAGLRRVRQAYTWDRVADSTHEAYSSVSLRERQRVAQELA